MKTGFGRGNLIGSGTRPLGRVFKNRLRIHQRYATGRSTPQSSTIVSGATISFQTANVCETITPVTDAPTEKPARAKPVTFTYSGSAFSLRNLAC